MNAANSLLPRYGALANRSLDEMSGRARVDVAPYEARHTRLRAVENPQARRASCRHRGIATPGLLAGTSMPAMAWKHLGEQSTSMAAASIWVFRTMRTNSRKAAARFMPIAWPCLDAQRFPSGRKARRCRRSRQLVDNQGICWRSGIRSNKWHDMFFACRCDDAFIDSRSIGRLIDGGCPKNSIKDWIDTHMEQNQMWFWPARRDCLEPFLLDYLKQSGVVCSLHALNVKRGPGQNIEAARKLNAA